MLVDQEDSNILSLCCEHLESFLDGCIVRLAVDNQEILLRIWRGGNMLRYCQLSCVLNA
jgi:hypothetical protein